jgi:hypothetical protein
VKQKAPWPVEATKRTGTSRAPASPTYPKHRHTTPHGSPKPEQCRQTNKPATPQERQQPRRKKVWSTPKHALDDAHGLLGWDASPPHRRPSLRGEVHSGLVVFFRLVTCVLVFRTERVHPSHQSLVILLHFIDLVSQCIIRFYVVIRQVPS